MKPRQLAAISIATLAASALSIPVANAQPEPSFTIKPNPARQGDELTVTGTCDAPAKPLVQSSGFVAPIPLGGKGKAVQRLGAFPVTMKCGDITVTSTLWTDTHYFSVAPDMVEPGGEITVGVLCPSGGETTATSPGFAAPIRVQFGGSAGWGSGRGKAADKPGRYTASLLCNVRGNPRPGERPNTVTFTILGNPDPGHPPTTEPPKKSKKPAQVVQKPKGAAETGGGVTAG